MHLSFLRRLFSHMEWADALLWRTVLTEEAAGDDDFIVDSLLHLHFVQRAYLDVWRGQSLVMVERKDFADVVAIRDWARPYFPEAAEFLSDLTEERLSDIIPLPWTSFIEKEIGGPASPASMGDTVFQVAAHSGHHRAQINRRIREVGGTPPMIDYIAWVWRGCAPADW